MAQLLRRREDARSLLLCTTKLGVLYASWWAYPSLSVVGTALVVATLACLSFFVATVAHNAMHLAVFAQPASDV